MILPICPKCKSNRETKEIVYGLIDPKDFNNTNTVLGGCCICPGVSPKWYCAKCEEEWGTLKEDEY